MTTENEDFAKQLAADAANGPRDYDETRHEEPQAHANYEGDVVPEDSWIDDETFKTLPPAAKAAFRDRLKHEKELAAQLARRDSQIDQLLQQSQQRSVPETPKSDDPFVQYDDAALESWQADAMRAQQAFYANPDDEAVRDAAARFSPERVLAIQRELVKRQARSIAEEHIGPLREQNKKSQEFQLAQNRTRNYISETYGNNVLFNQEPDSPAVRAHQRVLAQKEALGLGDNVDPKVEEALIRSAIDAEMAIESTRGAGARDRAGMRRQELEGAYSRASAPSSKRSAALSRGDSEAVYTHDLNSLMDDMGFF